MRFAAIALLLAGFIAGCGGSSGASQGDKDKAIAAAKFIYAGKAKEDLSAGPCLSEGIARAVRLGRRHRSRSAAGG